MRGLAVIALAALAACSTLLIPERQAPVMVARWDSTHHAPRGIPTATFLGLFVRADDLIMTRQAYRAAQEAWRGGWLARVEIALCAQAWDTVAGYVLVYQFTPATVEFADSLHIGLHACPDNAPWLHSHVVDNDWRFIPSPPDSDTARLFPRAFHILMSDTNSFKLYGRNP